MKRRKLMKRVKRQLPGRTLAGGVAGGVYKVQQVVSHKPHVVAQKRAYLVL